jgi:uncharacterized damage-inducible protein DinB
MEPHEAKAVADFLLSELANEMQTTLRVFGAVAGGKADYQPDPLSKTGLGLIRHITLEDERVLNGIANGAFEAPSDESVCGIMSAGDAIARYKERIPVSIERVRAMSGEQLCKDIDYLGAFQMPGLAFLSLMLKHSIHHRGQLSTYLRAMGGRVPGIYGPSADSQVSV